VATNDEHFCEIERARKWQVVRLRRLNFGISYDFEADWNNEIFMRCWAVRAQYDPKKGTLATFYGSVAEHVADAIGVKISRERQNLVYVERDDFPTDLAAENDASFAGPVSPATNDQSPAASIASRQSDQFSSSDLLHDLLVAVQTMPPRMLRLFEALSETDDMAGLQRTWPTSRATFYREVQRVRHHLAAHGMGVALKPKLRKRKV
jgi:hypothetical protein